MSTANDLLDSYKSSLEDLKQNSKPRISCLTMIADENIDIAEDIVQLIENRIYKVPAEQKIVCLYLVDSICKNIGKEYVKLFSKNLVKNFCHVFDSGDENIRLNLYKLRDTWRTLFPQSVLYYLDVNVKKFDPAWPITAKNEQIDSSNQVDRSPTIQQIHVNPDFKRSLDDKDERKLKFKKLSEQEPQNVNVNNKRILAERSSSPERKRSPSSNWSNSISRDLNNLNSDLSNLNNQFNDSQQKQQRTNQTTNLSNASIPGFNSNLSSVNVSSHLSLSSQPILSNLHSSVVQQPVIVSSIKSNQPVLNFLNQQQNATLVPSSSLNHLNSLSQISPANVLNHQLPTNLASALNSLNNFNIPTSKDVDYRINDFSIQPLPTDQLFDTFNERLLNSQQNQLMNLVPEELKLQVNGEIRKLFYLDEHIAVVLMNCLVDLSFNQLRHLSPIQLEPKLISFDGQPVNVYIDEKTVILLPFDYQWKMFYHNGYEQKIKFGGPAKEVYLNNQTIQAQFGGSRVPCKLNGDLDNHTIRLDLPAPKVKLSDELRIDLWMQILQKYSMPINNSLNSLNNMKPPFNMPMQGPPNIQATIKQQPPQIVMRPSQIINPQTPVPQSIAQQIIQPPPQPQTLPQFIMPPSNPFFTSTPACIPMINDQKSSIKQPPPQQQQITRHQEHKQTEQTQFDVETKSKSSKNNKNRKFKAQRDEKPRDPPLELKPESLKIKRQSLINSLYSGAQCTNCSLRFDNKTDRGKSKYSAHLDWHFRQNRRTRDNSFRTSNLNRDWYLPEDLWLKYKEINTEDDNDRMQNGLPYDAINSQSTNDDKQEQAQVPLMKANSDDSLNICSVCYERFNQIWCDEEEEWRIENAVLNEDKYYHPTCLSDLMNKTIEDESTIKSEETILRITDSMLENYEPSIAGDMTLVENGQLENLKLEEVNNQEQSENKTICQSIKQETDEHMIDIDQSIKEEILRELNEDSQNAPEVDPSTLVRKTVLNVFDVNDGMNEEMENDTQNSKQSGEQSDPLCVEQPVEGDLKVEIVGLNLPKRINNDESADETHQESIVETTNQQVKKIELVQTAKKPILLKLNIKDSNVMNLNQRKHEQVNSPKSESSKSPINRDPPDEPTNGQRDDVICRGREESALCSIM